MQLLVPLLNFLWRIMLILVIFALLLLFAVLIF